MRIERKIVALLPIKVHSERVPGKNFRKFCGKPLFRWILDSLLEVDEISQVIINTDAGDQAKSLGLFNSERVLLRERKDHLCGDFVSMNRVLADDIENVKADLYIMTHATNPLLSSQSIKSALSKFISASCDGGYDSLFSVNKFQNRFYRTDGTAINHDPNHLIRTQDLEPWFEENSLLYLFTENSFKSTNARIGLKPFLYETPLVESIDIDNPETWLLAELVCLGMSAKKGII